MRRMNVNRDKTDRWKADVARSVDLYNAWFLKFAPKAFRDTRAKTAKSVTEALKATDNLLSIKHEALAKNPWVLPTLRMSTCPPIARDRLIGLSGVSKNLVENMEDGEKPRIPIRMSAQAVKKELTAIGATISAMADRDIFVWLERKTAPTAEEITRAATIVADRLCGSLSDPIIRNAQEKRQLAVIGDWLTKRGYKQIEAGSGVSYNAMPPGTFSFRTNIPVTVGGTKKVNIPVDVAIMPRKSKAGSMPLLVEAKSAGDFTNTNKRRKEEAVKIQQLRETYGPETKLLLFLCGYFDTGYLGYEAAEGIDWVWEHRPDDLSKLGL